MPSAWIWPGPGRRRTNGKKQKKKPLLKAVFRATDGTRTRDLHLGKVAYYQLYYYRISYFVFLRTITTIPQLHGIVNDFTKFFLFFFFGVFYVKSQKEFMQKELPAQFSGWRKVFVRQFREKVFFCQDPFSNDASSPIPKKFYMI